MSKNPLQATPQQRLAIETEAPYVLVSASAGTGKTKTLVDRVIHLLTRAEPQPIALDRLLVITFTKKAADELKERLFKAFRGDPALAPLCLRLPQAYVTTIDAFCARLLREHAIAAGIDPAFRILADPDDELMIGDLLDDLLHHWYIGQSAPGFEEVPVAGSPPHQEFLRLVELCGFRRNEEQLREELRTLMAQARVRPDPERFIDELEEGRSSARAAEVFADMLRSTWEAGISLYARFLARGREAFPDREKDLAKHRAFFSVLASAPQPDLPALRDHLIQSGHLDPEKTWQLKFPSVPRGMAPLLKEYNDLAKRYIGGKDGPFSWVAGDADGPAITPTVHTLLTLLRQLMARYEQQKRERGWLDFSDLGLALRRLLCDPPPGLATKFDMVLIDEFQDVNHLQAEIAALLKPARGRFLVGDIKQCIYQFRLSDPVIFRALFDGAHVLEPGGQGRETERQRIYMSRNFRSRYPVLALINSLFGTIFPRDMIGGDYADEALRYHPAPELSPLADEHIVPYLRSDPAGAPQPERFPDEPGWAPAEIHFIETTRRGTEQAGDIRIATEARIAARRIRTLQQEGFRVHAGGGRWRPLRLSDIAVILRSPGPTGPLYARVLREEGFAVAYGGQGFFEREEVIDFLSLLHLLNNAHDDIALAAVLRSPAADFTEADLLRLRLGWQESLSLLATLRATATGQTDQMSGPETNPRVLSAALRAKCTRFLEQLDRWRSLVQTAALPAAIAAILDESRLNESASVHSDGPARRGHLAQCLTLTRRYCREQDHGLPGLIHYFESVGEARVKRDVLPADEAGRDAIRILSLHKSKGLEFPIVILALLGRRFNDQSARKKLLTGDAWIGMDAFDPQTYVKTPTLARLTLAQQIMLRSREEELRVLYVAVTRAREKLIITGTAHRAWGKYVASFAPWQGEGPLPETLQLDVGHALDWIAGTLNRFGLLDEIPGPGEIIVPEPGLLLARHEPEPLEATPVEESRTAEPGLPALSLSAAREALLPVVGRLERHYAHPAATSWRGKFWVTELKHLIADAHREEGAAFAIPGSTAPAPTFAPAEEGTWLHAVMAALDPRAADAKHVLKVATELAAAGTVPEDWVTPAQLAPVTGFFPTPLGTRMVAAADTLAREANFSLRIAPARLAALLPDAAQLGAEDWILIQGQIDALWREPDGRMVLVDFKTDRDTRRAEQYRPQLMLYREALRELWNADRVEVWLAFIRVNEAIRLD